MPRRMGRIAVTGSVAFDTILVFPGRFADHILPESTHLINLSFLVERMERRRGGTAANIAYTLALLGERPLLAAAVGSGDFAEYGEQLAAVGVDLGAVLRVDGVGTAGAYITTDRDDNQIAGLHPGAMAHAAAIDLRAHADLDVVVVSPDAPDAMAAHVEQAAALGARLVFVPAQQLTSMPDADLRAGVEAGWIVAGNDYEWELIRSRVDSTPADVARRGGIAVVTRGAAGSELHAGGETASVPAAPTAAVVDPTGAGDAYLAGLLVGLRSGRSLERAGRLAAAAAARVVERTGTQEHSCTLAELERGLGT